MMDEFDKTIPPQRSAGNDYLRQMETEEAQTIPGHHDRKTDGRFEPGDLIMGRYKVLAELGQGGMGVVYKCFDETAGIEVALKALPPELSHNSLEMEDIKENFQLVHALFHPHIAASNNLERNPENGNYYLIMECCEGEDLRRWIKRKRKDNPLTLNDVLPVIRQVADALDYAHAQKIMHRDIKPGNIMIDGAGSVKVLDFGLAAQIHTSMTRVSMAYHGTSGTGPYMAPEQWEGRVQDAKADQYALAVMTYEMLAGHLPFESADPAVLREAVLKSQAAPLENISSAAQNALKRAMSKEAAERFNSCADFAAALGGAKVAKAKKVSSGKSGGAWKWIAAVIVLALIAAGAFFALNRTTATPTAPVPADTAADAEASARAEAEARAKAEDVQGDREQTRQVTALVQEEVYRLQARVKNKKEEIESVRYDRGQTFGGWLDSLQENYTAGELALKNNDVSTAKSSFEKADQAADWLLANGPKREEVKALREQVQEQQKKADSFEGSRLAYVSYKEAEDFVKKADQSYKVGKFPAALDALKSARSSYEKAYQEARKQTVDNFVAAARTAKVGGNWQRVKDQAEAALKIDPGNQAAVALKNEAETHLVPTLQITATVDGARVPATVKIGADTWRAGDTIRDLKEDSSYTAHLSYRRGETEYTGEISFSCNWKGLKQKTVVLKKVEFTGVVTLPGGVQLKMIRVEPGSFMMGSENGSSDEKPVHRVTLTKPYYLGETEVTQAQWRAVMGTTVEEQRDKANTSWPLRGVGDNNPIYYVNWHEAITFCQKLNDEGRAPRGWQFTLPTEAQWEYAARGGNKSRGYTYSGSNDVGDVAWYTSNSGDETHAVRQKGANELGLYDMSGNVYEWCLDWYGSGSYSSGAVTDPQGPDSGSSRVLRGGGWYNDARYCRSAARDLDDPDYRGSDYGFRLALVPVQ